MKKVRNRLLAGLIAFAMIATCNVFPVMTLAQEPETGISAENTVTAEEVPEELSGDMNRDTAESVSDIVNDGVQPEISQGGGEEDSWEEIEESPEDTTDPQMLTFTAGNYSFGTDPVEWAQSGFNESAPKKYGCRIIAYSKMLVQTGAVPMSAVQNGSFNPGVLFDWFDRNGLVDSNLSEQGTPGVGAQTFAANFYGTTVTIEKKSFSGTDAQRKQLIVDGVNDGYVIILGQIGSGQHFVCVDSAKTLAEQYPYLQESYSKDLGRIVRCENGNRTLSSYTSIRYCKCTNAPEPGPDPTPTPSPTPTPVPTEYSGKCGDNLTWTLKEDSTKTGYYNLTISGTGPMYDYPEPFYNDDRTLTPWYACMQKIKENGSQYFNDVVLENGITKVGSYAFYNFSFLGNGHTISIPDTVTEIGAHAYAYSSFSGDLEIPDSVKTIGVSAFSGTNITSLTIGNGITEIPDYCFYGCDLLMGEITIPDGVVRIGEDAFAIVRYPELQNASRKIYLPNSLKEIDGYAFNNNTKLMIDAPILPIHLEKLGSGAFKGCASLTGGLVIPGTLTEVPYDAFRGCSGLTGLSIAEGVQKIGIAAFYGCSSITGELNLPNGLYEVSEAAFKNCSSLTGLKLPEKIADDRSLRLGNAAFENCSQIKGELVLDEELVYISSYDSNRIFLGTGLDRIFLQGKWYDYAVKHFKGIEETGSYYSYADQDEYGNSIMNGVDVSTFPEGITICYDDKPYLPSRKDGNPAGQELELRNALKDLGYTWKSYSEAGITSPTYYIRKARGYDISVVMGRTNSLSLYGPDYADDRDKVQFTLEDPSIATVEHDGRQFSSYYTVTPNKVGRTGYTVTINTKDNGLQTASGTITVVADDKSVTGVSLNYSSNTIEKGKTFTLKATVRPSTAKNKTVTWTSSDPSVATVTNKGVVKGVGKGDAVITATTKDGGFIASCTVTVTAVTYRVNFDGNGAEGSMEPVECDYGKVYTLPKSTSFHKAGYTFGGWGTDVSCATLMKSVPKDRSTDITVYAKWVPWSYTVVYDANKQPGMTVSGRMATTSAKYGTDLKLRPNTFVNKGYRFEGWSLDKNGTEALEALPIDEDYAPWDGIEAVEGLCPDRSGASVKLYALWKASDYLISYELNGGKKDDGTSDQYVEAYTYGIADPIILPTPVREGYKFEGWFTDSALKKRIKQIDKKTFGDLTLYAKWSTPYKVILKDLQGGETKEYKGYTFNKEKALPANPFQNEYKAFMGWVTEDEDQIVYANKAKIKDPVLEKGEDGTLQLTLYAVWKESMSLTMELDGGSYQGNERNKIEEGEHHYLYSEIVTKAITLPKTAVKDGYKFAGWYDLLTGTKVSKIDKKSFRDYQIEAAWVPLTYQIVYNANIPKGAKGGGKMTTQKLTFAKDAFLNRNNFYVNGYRFKGWSTDKNAYAPQFTDEEAFDFTKAGYSGYKNKVTLYAVWESD